MAAGVPTIWMGVLPELEGARHSPTLRAIPCGGSAVPRSLSEAYRERTGLPDPAGLGHDRDQPGGVDRPAQELRSRTRSTRRPRPICAPPSAPIAVGVDFRVVDPVEPRAGAVGRRQPGRAAGRRAVDRPGATTTTTARRSRSPPDGWLRTGDVATVDAEGYMRIVDRTKDVVKSGGEWISSVELENEIMGHPKVAEAAVIGVPHPKWSERPLACVVVQARRGAHQGGGARVPARRGWPSGGCPTTWCSSTRSPRPRSASSPRRTLRDQFADYQLPTA